MNADLQLEVGTGSEPGKRHLLSAPGVSLPESQARRSAQPCRPTLKIYLDTPAEIDSAQLVQNKRSGLVYLDTLFGLFSAPASPVFLRSTFQRFARHSTLTAGSAHT